MKNTNSQPITNDALKKEKAETDKAQKRIAQGLRDLLVDGLKDIYWAEKALAKAMSKMIKNVTSDTLMLTLSRHLEMTKGHITQLESVFSFIGEKAKGKKCGLMSGLIKATENAVDNIGKGIVRDAAIISLNRKIRYHEIATYGVLHSLAITLNETDAAHLLKQGLAEEIEADEQLLAMAKSFFTTEIILINKDFSIKKTNKIVTNRTVLINQNTPESEVLISSFIRNGNLRNQND
jgi:ferritin-like metal-binding protein YciE